MSSKACHPWILSRECLQLYIYWNLELFLCDFDHYWNLKLDVGVLTIYRATTLEYLTGVLLQSGGCNDVLLVLLFPWKGYKLTEQGRSFFVMGWRLVSSETQGGQMLSTMTMDKDVAELPDMDASTISAEHRMFKREVGFLVNLSCRVLFIVSSTGCG